jgi:hypothetical protein
MSEKEIADLIAENDLLKVKNKALEDTTVDLQKKVEETVSSSDEFKPVVIKHKSKEEQYVFNITAPSIAVSIKGVIKTISVDELKKDKEALDALAELGAFLA